MTSGTSQDQFQLYRGRGQAENFIKEMKEGFFGDKTDSSTLIKNEVRMMMSCNRLQSLSFSQTSSWR
ncbi:IS1380-Spn1 transposase [Streptococcus pneumoniae]|nr:IS1380-Spn1 transposase [Streptococcus pneumoniae]